MIEASVHRLGFGLAALVPSIALGQFGPTTLLVQQQEPIAEASPLTVIVSGEPRFTFRGDIRDADADVQLTDVGASARFIWEANEDLRLTFEVGGRYSWYDWGGDSAVFPGGSDSFEDVLSVHLIASGRQRISGPWALILGGVGRSQSEVGADFGDSITAGGFVAAGYDFSEEAWIDFGVGAFSRLEDDPLLIPYFNVRWPISDKVRLDISGLDGAVVGVVSEHLEVALRGRVEYRDFRLDDSRPAWRDGVVRDLRIPVGVEVAWKPVAGLTLAVEGGAAVYQEFEFLDSDGDHLSDVETEPTAFVGFRIEYRF